MRPPVRFHRPTLALLGVVLTALGAFALEHRRLLADRHAWPGLALGAAGAVVLALAPQAVRRGAGGPPDPAAPARTAGDRVNAALALPPSEDPR